MEEFYRYCAKCNNRLYVTERCDCGRDVWDTEDKLIDSIVANRTDIKNLEHTIQGLKMRIALTRKELKERVSRGDIVLPERKVKVRISNYDLRIQDI